MLVWYLASITIRDVATKAKYIATIRRCKPSLMGKDFLSNGWINRLTG